MPAKKIKTGDAAINHTADIFNDEDAARNWLESKRWPNGVVCPHCASTEAYKLTAKAGSKSPVRPGVYKCKACRKQFTVRIGTIFEDSRLPLRKWLNAIFLMCSSKKGVSSHQLARTLDITVKSGWFLSHRIRESMTMEPMAGMLSGAVEVDETYVGGKQRFQFGRPGKTSKKTPVLAMTERGGKVVAKVVPNASAKSLLPEI